MTVALLIIAIVAMVAVSGFLAASETAIGALSRADLEELAAQSPRSGRFVRRIAADPEAHSGALSFTRVLLETMSAVLVTLLLVDVFAEPWQAFLVAVGIMIVASFLLTGSSPRSVGRAHPAGVLRASAWLARLLRIVLGPFAQLLVRVGDRVTPGRPSRAGSVTSEEHLLSMVDEAAELDVLEDDDRARIHSLFAFGDRIVREVMVARTDMVTADAAMTSSQAMSMLVEVGLSRMPVIGGSGDDVRGVLYLKDLVAYRLNPEHDDIAVETLARPADFVPESLAAAELLQQMQLTSSHFAMVVDEYGGIAGLVTIEDLIEELVGEISDEYDHDEEVARLIAPGEYRVPTQYSTDDLGDLFDLEIDDDDVDTVGGLMGKSLGKVPERGDVAHVAGLRIVAERIGRRGRVTTVLVRREDAATTHGEELEAGRAEVDAALQRHGLLDRSRRSRGDGERSMT